MSKDDLMQKVASQSPALVQFLNETSGEVNESPFKEEILGEMDAIIKHAEFNLKQTLGKMKGPAGRAAFAIGGPLAGAVAAHLAGDIYDAARRGLTKSRNYKAMLKANPDIAEMAQENPDAIKSHFNTLHKLNPEFSSDPHIAAAYINQGLSYGADLNTAQSLVQSRKNLRDTRALRPLGNNPFQSSMEREQAQTQLKKTKHEADTARLKNEREIVDSASRGLAPTARMRAYAREQ